MSELSNFWWIQPLKWKRYIVKQKNLLRSFNENEFVIITIIQVVWICYWIKSFYRKHDRVNPIASLFIMKQECCLTNIFFFSAKNTIWRLTNIYRCRPQVRIYASLSQNEDVITIRYRLCCNLWLVHLRR